MLPNLLTRVDDTTRDDHYYLSVDDQCFFFGDYHSGRGWQGGPTNSLITNYKRTPTEIAVHPNSHYLRGYKERAIDEIAAALRATMDQGSVESRLTFVPIPPSKTAAHPDYCDRLVRTLKRAFHGYDADIRPLLIQTEDIGADHVRNERISIERLREITAVDPAQLQTPLRQKVVLFDDVLTTGKHFSVACDRIREQIPDQDIVGVFVARCVRPENPDHWLDP